MISSAISVLFVHVSSMEFIGGQISVRTGSQKCPVETNALHCPGQPPEPMDRLPTEGSDLEHRQNHPAHASEWNQSSHHPTEAPSNASRERFQRRNLGNPEIPVCIFKRYPKMLKPSSTSRPSLLESLIEAEIEARSLREHPTTEMSGTQLMEPYGSVPQHNLEDPRLPRILRMGLARQRESGSN